MKRLVQETLPNKMIINFNMFCAGMKNGISCEVNGANVVANKDKGAWKRHMEFTEKGLKPNYLSCSAC